MPIFGEVKRFCGACSEWNHSWDQKMMDVEKQSTQQTKLTVAKCYLSRNIHGIKSQMNRRTRILDRSAGQSPSRLHSKGFADLHANSCKKCQARRSQFNEQRIRAWTSKKTGLLSRNNPELLMIFENPWRAFSKLEILCFGKTQTGLYNASEDSEFPIRDHAWRRLRRIFF